jgi:hypothetical protein
MQIEDRAGNGCPRGKLRLGLLPLAIQLASIKL